MYNTKRAFSLLEKISFVRTGGSEEELKAANILKEEIAEDCHQEYRKERFGNHRFAGVQLRFGRTA